MADAKLTALTAASALAAADLFYVSQSAASRKATGTQLLALVGTTYVPLAGGTMTGALAIASGTLAASAPAMNITQTWTTGAAFNALVINITDTSSTALSTFAEFQVGGQVRHSWTKAGIYTGQAGVFATGGAAAGVTGPGMTFNYYATGIRQSSLAEVAWTSGNNNGTMDLALYRDSAATLAQRNGTNAQTLRVYGTYTDSSNYERLTLSTTAGTGVTIAAETLGTGSDNLSLTLASSGTGHVIFSAPNITIQNNVGLRNGDSVGTGRLYLDVSNVVFRRGDGASLPGMWKFGGETSSFAALRCSSTTIQSRLADDSGYGSLESLNLGQTGYHQMTEMTAPSAPATNSVRIYAEDNGSGKTRLMALFATGSAVQLGIEP